MWTCFSVFHSGYMKSLWCVLSADLHTFRHHLSTSRGRMTAPSVQRPRCDKQNIPFILVNCPWAMFQEQQRKSSESPHWSDVKEKCLIILTLVIQHTIPLHKKYLQTKCVYILTFLISKPARRPKWSMFLNTLTIFRETRTGRWIMQMKHWSLWQI